MIDQHLITVRPERPSAEESYFEQFRGDESDAYCHVCQGFGKMWVSYGRPPFLVTCDYCDGSGIETGKNTCVSCGNFLGEESICFNKNCELFGQHAYKD